MVWIFAVRSFDEDIQYRKGRGTDTTHCRVGTQGITPSTRWAAVWAIRRPAHEGQNPRRLQLKAIDSRKKIREPDGGGEWTGQCTRDTAFLSDHHHHMALRRRYPPCPFPYTSAPLHASNSIAGFSKPMAVAICEWSGVSRPCSRWLTTRAFRRLPRCSTWASKPFATIATPFSSRASRVWFTHAHQGDRAHSPHRNAESWPP